jgi:hypothetical protein
VVRIIKIFITILNVSKNELLVCSRWSIFSFKLFIILFFAPIILSYLIFFLFFIIGLFFWLLHLCKNLSWISFFTNDMFFENWLKKQGRKSMKAIVLIHAWIWGNLRQNILVTAECFGWRWQRFHFTGAHISHKFKQDWNFMTNYSVNVGADSAFTWYFRRKKNPPSKYCIVIRPQID